MTLQEEIYTAIGEASMCWEQPLYVFGKYPKHIYVSKM
jgi:hypothetical protein